MKRKILPFLIVILSISACSTDTTVQVARNPLLQFTLDSVSWKASNYFFTGPYQVVAYPSGSTQPGQLYNRLTLQAVGKDNTGKNLQFNITFDATNANQLIGVYRPLYTASGGLSQVQLFNLDNNNLAAYQLCADDTTALFQIQRQSTAEKLIAGNFQMMLCNTRDTTQKIHVTNGVVTDIHY